MPAVGPGTSIGGRYHLRQRLDHADGVERWEADDTTAGRRVWVTVVDADHPGAAAALDAARRVSTLSDPHLLPVVDAGSDRDMVHIVEEAPESASTLTQVLRDGPLPPRTARRVVLDVAQALSRAAGRGLHHLSLTPDSVLRTRDGDVLVRGVAVQGALRGRDDVADEDASRTDATALAALLHAALTATWPGRDASSLTPTPRMAGVPVAPSELVPAVPRDLDELVSGALGRHASGRNDAPGSEGPGATAEILRAGAEPEESEAAPGDPQGGTTEHAVADDLRADVEHVPGKAEAAALAAAGATAAGAKAVGRGVSTAAREASRRASERRRERDERRAEEDGATRVPFESLATESDHDVEPVAPVFVNDVPTGTPSPRQASCVLALVSGLVVVGLVAGVIGLVAMVTNIRRQLDAGPTPQTFTVTAPAVTVTAAAKKSAAPSTTASPSSSTGAPIPVVGVSAYDPEGDDDGENNAQANNVRDGDAGTSWRSQRYKTDAFGGLKDGVGLVVYLGDQHDEVHQVTLTLPDGPGQDLQLLGSDQASKDGATQIGKVTGGKGTVTVPVPSGQGKHPYLVVWFTNSPQASNGGHYASLSEIALS